VPNLVYFVPQAEKEPASRHTWLQIAQLGFDGTTLSCDPRRGGSNRLEGTRSRAHRRTHSLHPAGRRRPPGSPQTHPQLHPLDGHGRQAHFLPRRCITAVATPSTWYGTSYRGNPTGCGDAKRHRSRWIQLL